MLHRVIYTQKDERSQLIEKVKIFNSVASACSFINEIKGQTFSKPILETVTEKHKNKKGKNDRRIYSTDYTQ